MGKQLNIYDAQDIIRDDLKQIDKTVSGLKNKADTSLLKEVDRQGKSAQNDEDTVNNAAGKRTPQPGENKKGSVPR